MPKVLKYLLIAACALIALFILAAVVIAATFDPNTYKPLIVKTVKEKTQRTLTIPGTIHLTFFPRIGADLGQVALSEHGSNAEFASVNSAKVSVALIPLLSKRVEVDRVIVDGLHADIKRYKDGTTNFDDLTSKNQAETGASTQGPTEFNIGGIDVTNSSVIFDDRQEDRRLDISNLNLHTGKIANGTKSDFKLSAHVIDNKPAIDASVSAESDFLFELADKHYVLNGLNAEVKGRLAGFEGANFQLKGNADLRPETMRFALDGIELAASGKQAGQSFDLHCEVPKLAVTDKAVSGGKVNGKAKLDGAGRNVSADFSMASFEGSPKAFKIAALTIDAAIKQADLDAKAKIDSAVTGDIDNLQFVLPKLKITLDGKQNGSAVKLAASGQASTDLKKHTMSSTLSGTIDDSHFNAKLGLASFSPAAYTFDIGIDRIDADRYMKKSAATPAGKPPTNAPEQPMDLSALKTLNAMGSLRVGALKAENIKASNVRLDLHAAAGKLDIRPFSADLYGGSAAGGMSVDATSLPRFGIQQKLANIEVGNLLKDAIGKAQIDGKGDVQLDVRAQGNVVSRIKKSLDGTAKLNLRDGAIYGINIAKSIRDAKSKLNALRGGDAPQAGTASKEEKTDFSEMSASFRIANGVAHNDDLSAKSPLIRLGGSGDVDIGESRIDYLAKATVVSSLEGQGGPELQALKGLTIPVKLYGPFDAIGWKIDFGGIVGSAAKQKIEEKKTEVTQKAKEKLQEQLGDKLKGLFGK